MSIKENNSGYVPAQKKYLVVFIANIKEFLYTPSGLAKYSNQEIAMSELSKLREGTIVDLGQDCFENFALIPKKGDNISFRGYSGEIYQNGDDFYRIFEDKHVIAIVNK